ncbi:MAG: hypothetical protein A2381_15045 [Bdellovibrionales bacterium RIFOXYB1_FULL_37_110]|nr:MAG: hypothetical protein A2417_10550 [Bdellovibrionales bacterium RIFOXYC1_FULL_37_79]OFZ60181.1 MAG: hypothetical protein A2381_15045 [Bdellovibrionales bacterium RIFOXYB1_FULL_37_110]OFZ64325.1 MAG: hypothetical protein A2577_09725 [Bdellovibrionales bacterium RIFOXYD1_FULL_36_51]
MITNQNQLRLGISACLLGAKVRYDGAHKLDKWIKNTLGQFATFIPICPELECKMSIPRPPMHLEGTRDNPHLIQTLAKLDLTKQMNSWIKPKIKELKYKNLDGYILKTRSPSCGLRDIKIFSPTGKLVSKTGTGLFAKAFLKAFPLLPVEDEDRLQDPKCRENFIERIFVMKRWRELLTHKKSLKALINFHTKHQLLMMSHSLPHYQKMGKLLASHRPDGLALYQSYQKNMLEALRLPTTTKKHFHVLQHAIGYFKSDLSSAEKKELLNILKQYKTDKLPLLVPITLINHYAKKLHKDYLLEQYYLNPHPKELKIKNHF